MELILVIYNTSHGKQSEHPQKVSKHYIAAQMLNMKWSTSSVQVTKPVIVSIIVTVTIK